MFLTPYIYMGYRCCAPKCRCLWKLEAPDLKAHRAGITSGWEPTNMGAGNRTWFSGGFCG